MQSPRPMTALEPSRSRRRRRSTTDGRRREREGAVLPFFLQSSEKGDKSPDRSPLWRKEQMSECLFKIIYLREGPALNY